MANPPVPSSNFTPGAAIFNHFLGYIKLYFVYQRKDRGSLSNEFFAGMGGAISCYTPYPQPTPLILEFKPTNRYQSPLKDTLADEHSVLTIIMSEVKSLRPRVDDQRTLSEIRVYAEISGTTPAVHKAK